MQDTAVYGLNFRARIKESKIILNMNGGAKPEVVGFKTF